MWIKCIYHRSAAAGWDSMKESFSQLTTRNAHPDAKTECASDPRQRTLLLAEAEPLIIRLSVGHAVVYWPLVRAHKGLTHK